MFLLYLRWHESTPMNVARMRLTVDWLTDGRMFAIGGDTTINNPSNTVEVLHWPWNSDKPTEPGWISLAPLLTPRLKHGSAFVSGKLVVAGGDKEGSTECFTLPCTAFPKGQWTKIRPVHEDAKLVGMLPFGEGLLLVRKCEIRFLFPLLIAKPLN